MDRAHSLPPTGGPVVANPWWSDRLKAEVALRARRPENLPLPQDGEDDDWEEREAAPVRDGRTGTSGKGHGEVPQGGSQSGRMFVTPPSHRQAEGRGQGRRSDGTMPMSATPTEKKSLGGQGKVTEGPLPPKVTAKASVSEPDHLQRAFEAEMVTFLREQNELLTSEVAELKRQQTMQGSATSSSIPSSWERVDGGPAGCGGGEKITMKSLHVEPPQTPRGRSPTKRGQKDLSKFTPNGTQVPPGPPPGDVDGGLELPPFPAPGTLAEQLRGYEVADGRRHHGDDHWLPLGLREGKTFEPRVTPAELHASRLEQEVADLRKTLERLKDEAKVSFVASSHDTSSAPQKGNFVGLHGHEFQDFLAGPMGSSHTAHGHDGVCPPNPDGVCQQDPWVSVPGGRNISPEPPAGGTGGYGRWRGDDGVGPAPLPWNEGTGNSKAELPELASDASPIELGDWLAVCGPVLRDISQVSARWWNLTLREAQCFYDRWKTSSPLARVQINPRLPDELLDGRYQRTEQRGVNLLLRAIPADQQQALITARELTSTALLFRLLVRYQPGGAGEKAILLSKLTVLDKSGSITELAAALRSWRRHFARAQEISAVLPDGTLLLKALEPACTQIATLDTQASFRLAQSRLQLDQQPHHQGVWRFSQCLLAEAETIALMSSTPAVTPSPVKVKQLEAPTKASIHGPSGHDKGKGTSMATTPCKYFRSESGCKAGKNCKWSHAWDGIDDKSPRCWICGGKDHRKQDCKRKSGTKSGKDGKTTSEPSGSGGGKSSLSSNAATAPLLSTPSTGGPSSTTTTPMKLKELEVAGEGQLGQSSEAMSTDGGGKGETGATSATSEALLQEATKLLKSLRAPTLKVIKVSQLEADPNGLMVLLDSGATHALRPALSLQEWEGAVPTQVTLADGITDKLRLKADSKVLLSNPADSELSWIVPLGGIAELGYRFEWKNTQCTLYDEAGQELNVWIQNGCPMVLREVGKAMIDRLERQQIRLVRKAQLLQAMSLDPSSTVMQALQQSTEMALTYKLRALFEDLPDDVLMRVIPDLSDIHNLDGQLLPWNRRKRRRVERAKQIVLHLFSGPDSKYWERALQKGNVEVLCVDLQAEVAADIHDDMVFKYLLSLAASGRVKALIGGPPCRTVSALRYQDDGGPGVLRTEQHPYGLPHLSSSDQALVTGDSVLLFRMLALYVLCEDVRHDDEPQTALAIEQPEDPARYRSASEVQEKQFMPIWRTKEWRAFEATYNVRLIHCDQGPMGHSRRKPTSLAVVLRDIHALDGVRGPSSGIQPEEQARDRQAMTMQERCNSSKQWAEWAPGLKTALALALNDHLHRGNMPSLDAALKPLGQVALDSWRQHYLNDHMPARRDCKDCVRSAARSKPHRKINHPEAYTLSIDLSGKMAIGQDQHRHDCKYMMVAVYTFPVDHAGNPLAEFAMSSSVTPPSPTPDDDEYTPTEPEGDDPGEDLLSEEAVPALEGPREAGDDAAVKRGQAAMEAWQSRVQEAQDVAVRNVTFVEVLPGRAVHHILQALARIYARLRSLGLPLYRLHCDRARELISAPVRRWTLDRGIVTTLTSGDSYKSNGRCEGELGVIKKHVRTVVSTSGLGLEHWPLVATHVGERRLRGQLRSLGLPVGHLLQFGTRAYALKKSWQDRYQPWRDIRDEVIILGPALQSSLTSTSYYVQSVETKRFFYTDDVVVPSHTQPEAADACVYLPEIGDQPPSTPSWEGQIPRRRLREKTAVPQLSMVYMEGEMSACVQKWLCEHRALFDEHAPNDPVLASLEVSSDSWTVETPARTSSSDSWNVEGTSEGSSQGTQVKGSGVEDSFGGEEKEEAPNNQDGGSCLVASLQSKVPGRIPITRIQMIQAMQEHLADYVGEEMSHIDLTMAEQGCYAEVVSRAIMHKLEAEETLLQYQQDQEALNAKELEEEFLVTKTVSNREVLDDFENWIPSITAEFDQLVRTKQAVEQITKRSLQDRAQREGKTIELLPAKMVYTRKSGAGVRRSRAVVCGNYSESRFNDDCYAGGADGCQVRALVRTAALRGWAVAATDIWVAFLNAPRRDDGKLVAMEIPSVYKRLGLAKEGEVWLVKLAMYGLTTSPRDWSKHRDATLPCISWVRMKGERKLRGYFVKTQDENLWRLEEVDIESGENLWSGLMSIYVDDILLAGEDEALSAGLTSLQSTWATSSVEWATPQTPVNFCGFEITVDEGGDGLHISQRKYEQEIIARWNVKEAVAFPRFKISEEDGEQQAGVDRKHVREAQAIAGSLLWLSTRSRPDLTYGVSALSRLVTKNPMKAIEVGRILMAYVKGNPGDLHYPREIHDKWGARGQLKVQRHDRLIEVYADIAYSAGPRHRSVQGLVICFAGAPIAWQSSTQPFSTHSTAESELVSYCEALVAGRATEALMCAMWGEKLDHANPFEKVIYGDNAAAIGLAHGNSNSSWRTRHLRVRSNILREALEENTSYPGGPWQLHHLKGTELVADGMTKPLAGQSFFGFTSDLGLKGGDEREARMKSMSTAAGQGVPPLQDRSLALKALVVGGAIVQAAEIQGEKDSDSTLGTLWMCGLLLIVIGAIWVGKTAVASVGCCVRRLHAMVNKPHHPDECQEDDEGDSETTFTEGESEEPQVSEWQNDGLHRRRNTRRGQQSTTPLKSSTSWPKGRQSGSQHRASSQPIRPRSGSMDGMVAKAASEAAEGAQMAADAADRAAESAERASRALMKAMATTDSMVRKQLAASTAASSTEEPLKKQQLDSPIQNPWNRFQHDNAGRGWSLQKMRAEYFKVKAQKRMP